MKYTVNYIIHGYYEVEVEAINPIEAEEKAQRKWEAADFGEVTADIDGFIYSITSDTGKEYKK